MKRYVLSNHEREQKMIVLMYLSAMVGVYFEHIASVALLIFLGVLFWLSIQKKDSVELQYSHKAFIGVSVIYGLVLLSSFVIHLPITDDGTWRLSSYSFILLLSWMFYVQLKYKMTESMMLAALIGSTVFATIVFIIEFWVFGLALLNDPWTRLGEFASIDFGGYGNFVMATLIVLVGVAAVQKDTRLIKWLVLAAILLFVFAVLTKSRTNLLFFPFLFLGYLVFAFQNKLFKLKPMIVKLALSLGIFAVAFMAYISTDRIKHAANDIQKLVDNEDYLSSLGLRVLMNKVGAQIVSENPMLGIGLNHFKSAKQEVLSRSEYSQVPQHAKDMTIGFTQIHNQFLMDMIFIGLPGLIALLLFIGYPLWFYSKIYFRQRSLANKFLALSGVMFISYTIFTGLFGSVFTYTYTSIMYMLVNAMLISYLSNLPKAKTQPKQV